MAPQGAHNILKAIAGAFAACITISDIIQHRRPVSLDVCRQQAPRFSMQVVHWGLGWGARSSQQWPSVPSLLAQGGGQVCMLHLHLPQPLLTAL